MRLRPSFISFFFLIVVLINFTGIVIAQPLDAILIIKDGKIVFERYSNQTNENTHFREVSKWRP
jgi:hypothetical protein